MAHERTLIMGRHLYKSAEARHCFNYAGHASRPPERQSCRCGSDWLFPFVTTGPERLESADGPQASHPTRNRGAAARRLVGRFEARPGFSCSTVFGTRHEPALSGRGACAGGWIRHIEARRDVLFCCRPAGTCLRIAAGHRRPSEGSRHGFNWPCNRPAIDEGCGCQFGNLIEAWAWLRPRSCSSDPRTVRHTHGRCAPTAA